jgi:hypothetical protein
VSPTEAGEHLLQQVGSRFDEIEAELTRLTALRDTPAGTIRITTTEYAADAVLWPKLQNLLRDYPEIKVELISEQGLTDIVAVRYDAGVRLGVPSYFMTRSPPQAPRDLISHNCINLRLPTHGGLYAWEFEKGKRKLNVHVDG